VVAAWPTENSGTPLTFRKVTFKKVLPIVLLLLAALIFRQLLQPKPRTLAGHFACLLAVAGLYLPVGRLNLHKVFYLGHRRRFVCLCLLLGEQLMVHIDNMPPLDSGFDTTKNPKNVSPRKRNSSIKEVYMTASAHKQLLSAYTDMVKARLIDEKTIVLYKQNKCHFQIGVAGHEAVQVAASRVLRAGKDWFYPYYRDMALMVGLGMSAQDLLLNAMNKEADPNSHGRQMPMHYGSVALNVVSQSSPTGTQFLQAVGCALASSYKGLDEVTYVSAGEGTCAQGDFHEAINWAARDKLPAIFLIENNQYAISVHISEQLAGQSVYKLTAGYEGLHRYQVDGTDYEACLAIFREAHENALAGKGPSLIEAMVPRLQSHSISDNHLKYRNLSDIEQEKSRDPLRAVRKLLLERQVATEEELNQIETQLKTEIDAASEWAESQPNCTVSEATATTYAEPEPWKDVVETPPAGDELFLVDAINRALDEELARDDRVMIFGEDVAHGKGGVFTVTAGLTAKYGVKRVFNSQLAESSIAGVAVGVSTRGLKPVAEIQFGDYVWTAMMQIRNELAMMSYRSKGDFTCPAVIRIPVGGYIHGGAYHSQNIEATFAHFPGLYVVYPSNAADAKGLLKASIRGKDPVLFLEHKGLYRQPSAKCAVGSKDDLVPLGKASVVRKGDDLTIVTWGYLVQRSLTTAHLLESEGYSVEVIDLRTIVPFDAETVLASVRKTGRVLIAHEDVTFMGFGAEIAAQIARSCFTYLDAPVERLGMKPVAHVPHSSELEEVILPQQHDVTAAARAVLAF
jgi:2-oxoisovalerate dehydrogenase E1 component